MVEPKTLKVPFQQTTKSGCGSYSLANLLNDDQFIKEIQNDKYGEGVADLNKKLSQFAPDLYIDCIFAAPSEMTVQPNKLIDPLVFQVVWEKMEENHLKNYCRPFLATIKKSKFHCILILHNFKNDLYYVVDSLCNEIIVMTINDLLSRYHITTVELVCCWNIEDTANRDVFFKKSFLSHIIPEGE